MGYLLLILRFALVVTYIAKAVAFLPLFLDLKGALVRDVVGPRFALAMVVATFKPHRGINKYLV
jgi:hypothetical protein